LSDDHAHHLMAINRCDAITSPMAVSSSWNRSSHYGNYRRCGPRLVSGVPLMVIHLAFQIALDDHLGQPP
jgi:hypothetical protein